MRRIHRRKRFRPQITLLEDRAVPSATILYVDATNSAPQQNGSTWARAFSSLQDALTRAASLSGPTQIWLAQGTYKPSQVDASLDPTSDPSMKTFDLPNNVSLYGGFTSGMKSLSQRDPTAHPTVLSGDLLGNDINNSSASGYAASKADNVWHVVTAGNNVTKTGVTATLDGLQIVGGYADGPNLGGTLSPYIEGNSDGGGVCIAWNSNITVNNVVFKNNFAASDGGGLFADSSTILVTNSSFLNNSALVRAGGLEGLNDFENGVSHTSTLLNDYFQDNTCAVFGGAVVGEGAGQGQLSTMTIKGCTFVHNLAAEGGAIVIDTLKVSVDSSTFTNNIATVDGGALATTNVVGTIVGQPNNFATTITNSSFINNLCQADAAAHDTLNGFVGAPGLNFAYGGGALVCYMNGFLNVDGDLFLNNGTANGDGGAILNGDSSTYNLFGVTTAFAVHTTVTNSIFLGNQAMHGNGGAIASEPDHVVPTATAGDTSLTVAYCVITLNQSGGNGGGLYFDTSTATIKGTLLALNSALQGDQYYAKQSQLTWLLF